MRHPAGRLVTALVACAVSVALVAGCGGSSSEKKAAKTPQQRLDTAQRYLDASKAVTIDLRTPELPRGTQGVLKATGVGTQAPAFKGKISVVQSGLSVEVPVVAVDGKVYVRFAGSYQDVDPSDFGAPDPAQLFKKGGGLSSALGAITGVKKGKDTRQGKKVLSTLTGTMPGSAVATIIPSAGSDEDFATVLTLDQDDHLVSARLTGPFYPDADDVTYTIGFSKYGQAETIAKP